MNNNALEKLYDDHDICIRKVYASLFALKGSTPHLLHAKNTFQWCENLMNEIGNYSDSVGFQLSTRDKLILNVAAYANDLHYAGINFGMKASIANYNNYRSYRLDSHRLSSSFFERLVGNTNVDAQFIKDVQYLINNHETNHSNHQLSVLVNILKDADALSYFDVLSTFDFERCLRSTGDISRRFEYEYRRISNTARKYLLCFYYSNDKQLDLVMHEIREKCRKYLSENDYDLENIKNIGNRAYIKNFQHSS